MLPILHSFSTGHALARAAAQVLAECARQAVGDHGRFTIGLSGGSTPRALHGMLASEFGEAIPWDSVQVFWGDERWVPADHPASNARMARETLLSRVPIPEGQVFAIPTDGETPEADARRYEQMLRTAFPGATWPAWDLLLLGIGDDGHTASLFPGTPALTETERWVAVGNAPVEPRERITLTLPAINAAREAWFLVTGQSKRELVGRAFRGDVLLPAGKVQAQRATVWFVDAAANPGLT